MTECFKNDLVNVCFKMVITVSHLILLSVSKKSSLYGAHMAAKHNMWLLCTHLIRFVMYRLADLAIKGLVVIVPSWNILAASERGCLRLSLIWLTSSGHGELFLP